MRMEGAEFLERFESFGLRYLMSRETHIQPREMRCRFFANIDYNPFWGRSA